MTQEDIIRMAREAGVSLKDDPEKASGVGNAIVSYYDLKRFADLVAEHLCEKRREAWLDWARSEQ